MSRAVKLVVSIFGVGLMSVFVLGLSKSISSGFAGFWGGLPFMIIAIAVICMAFYDLWEENFKKDK
ncbi:MAG: hypothetical protein EP307_02455 [Rhodobacteraceae bacterium]|nr:MAG: hypothetical protein EP307_02455 [Paracoccaceae bacterium]